MSWFIGLLKTLYQLHGVAALQCRRPGINPQEKLKFFLQPPHKDKFLCIKRPPSTGTANLLTHYVAFYILLGIPWVQSGFCVFIYKLTHLSDRTHQKIKMKCVYAGVIRHISTETQNRETTQIRNCLSGLNHSKKKTWYPLMGYRRTVYIFGNIYSMTSDCLTLKFCMLSYMTTHSLIRPLGYAHSIKINLYNTNLFFDMPYSLQYSTDYITLSSCNKSL